MPSLEEIYRSNAVAITGGTIDGVVVGGTTPAAGTFTTATVAQADDATGLTITGWEDQAGAKVTIRVGVAGNGFIGLHEVANFVQMNADGNLYLTPKAGSAVNFGVDGLKVAWGAAGVSDSYVSYEDSTGWTLYDNIYGATRTLTQLANIVNDTTPQLGGDLDANGNTIHFGTAENTQTPEVTTATIDLGAENHHTLNCGSATGAIDLTVTVPAGPTAGTIIIVQDDAEKAVTFLPSSGAARWLGTAPTYVAYGIYVISWRWDATNLYLSATDAYDSTPA